MATSVAEAGATLDELGGTLAVVKAQVHAGGRGKGIAVGPKDDFAEAYKMALGRKPRGKGRPAAFSGQTRRKPRAAASLLGKHLITYRTGPEGQVINKVLVTTGHYIARELYLGLAVDRGRTMSGVDGFDRRGVGSKRSRTNIPRESSAKRSTSVSASKISKPAKFAKPSVSQATPPRRAKRS